jgi:hypothetical protein
MGASGFPIASKTAVMTWELQSAEYYFRTEAQCGPQRTPRALVFSKEEHLDLDNLCFITLAAEL